MSTLKTKNKENKRGRFRNMSTETLRKEGFGIVFDNEESRIIYTYPLSVKSATKISKIRCLLDGIPQKEIYNVGYFKTAKSPESHIGPFKNAIDFLVPDREIVYAAQSGIVLEIKEDSTTFGDGEKFRDYANYITIEHDKSYAPQRGHIEFIKEYSQYIHLERFSVSKMNIEIGQRIEKGRPIGIVGKSGWTDRDHLHFIVYREDGKSPFGFKSLKIKFKKNRHSLIALFLKLMFKLNI